MKNIKNIILALLIAGCTALSFAGCTVTNEQTDVSAEAETVNPVEDVVEEEPEETVTEPEVVEPVEEESEVVVPEYINKLTGMETTEELSAIRPVAIMINNIKVATPQQGISQADIVYEVLAEGGITRLLCLFTDYATLPETGSIRSARDYYIDLSDAHDAIYVHCGTSPQADAVLSQRKTENMNGIYFNTPFYRNKWRQQNMGQEHSLMTTGELLVKGIAQKGYRTTSEAAQPLAFNLTDTAFEGTASVYSSLKFSYYATSEFEYDEAAGVYMKKQYGKAHIDSNNDTQLSFENVIYLFCNQGRIAGDTSNRIYVNFYGDGDGYYMSDGAYKKIKWHKDSRTSTYTLYEEDGVTPLNLNPGKSYIAIAPMDAEVSFK